MELAMSALSERDGVLPELIGDPGRLPPSLSEHEPTPVTSLMACDHRLPHGLPGCAGVGDAKPEKAKLGGGHVLVNIANSSAIHRLRLVDRLVSVATEEGHGRYPHDASCNEGPASMICIERYL